MPHWLKSLKETPVVRSFCVCNTDPNNYGIGKKLPCSCGEEFDVHEWVWDDKIATSITRLSKDDKEIQFHPGYSSGTAAIRGTVPFVFGNDYYWEIKVLTPLYGTDVMIGVGTKNVDLQGATHNFCSLLGSDEESWGFSYHGLIQHKNRTEKYGSSFGQGSIVGVHLDMWQGTLQFYLNRKPLGIAFTGLQGRTLYPMVSSTAAKSAMRVTYSASTVSTLQLMCLQAIKSYPKLIRTLRKVPFLRSQVDRQFWWLIPSENDLIKEAGQDSDFDSGILDELDFDSSDTLSRFGGIRKSGSSQTSDANKNSYATVKRKRLTEPTIFFQF